MNWFTKIRTEILYRWRTRNGLPWNAGLEMTMRCGREALRDDLRELQRLAIETTKRTSIMKELIPRIRYIDKNGELIEEDEEEYDTQRD